MTPEKTMELLTSAQKFIEMGFDCEQEVYGRSHKDAMDTLRDIRYAVATLAQPAIPQEPIDGDIAFEEWWSREGQFHRAGGGDYEKTFAYYAWTKAAQPAPQQEPKK